MPWSSQDSSRDAWDMGLFEIEEGHGERDIDYFDIDFTFLYFVGIEPH